MNNFNSPFLNIEFDIWNTQTSRVRKNAKVLTDGTYKILWKKEAKLSKGTCKLSTSGTCKSRAMKHGSYSGSNSPCHWSARVIRRQGSSSGIWYEFLLAPGISAWSEGLFLASKAGAAEWSNCCNVISRVYKHASKQNENRKFSWCDEHECQWVSLPQASFISFLAGHTKKEGENHAVKCR